MTAFICSWLMGLAWLVSFSAAGGPAGQRTSGSGATAALNNMEQADVSGIGRMALQHPTPPRLQNGLVFYHTDLVSRGVEQQALPEPLIGGDYGAKHELLSWGSTPDPTFIVNWEVAEALHKVPSKRPSQRTIAVSLSQHQARCLLATKLRPPPSKSPPKAMPPSIGGEGPPANGTSLPSPFPGAPSPPFPSIPKTPPSPTYPSTPKAPPSPPFPSTPNPPPPPEKQGPSSIEVGNTSAYVYESLTVAGGLASLEAANSPVTADQPSLAYQSALYDSNGQTNPELSGRLMDWSYAGYMAGEQELPKAPASCSVKDYGAKGDGKTDDSQAFQAAIAAMAAAPAGGVIFIPAGSYVLSVQLTITQSGTVLRGAGEGLTTLMFTKSMTNLFGQTWKGGSQFAEEDAVQSDWKNAPGLIRFLGPNGPDNWQPLAKIMQPATRGTTTLNVSDVSRIKVGAWLSFAQAYTGISLPNDMNMRKKSYTCPTCISPGSGGVLRWHSRVTAVGPGSLVLLERALPFNVSLLWSPMVYMFMEGITQAGIEYVTIQMKWQQYRGHFTEAGWNGVEFTDASNCWARNVTILNGDTLMSVYRSSFVTVANITTGVTASRSSNGRECHHGMNASSSQDVLFANITHGITCYHDMTSFNFTVGVVFANVTGPDICMDHHRFYPYGTLWSNINVGAGTHPFLSGGLSSWGTVAASFTTFWNVSCNNSGPLMIGPPGYDMGPQINFVGTNFDPTVLFNPIIASGMNWFHDTVPAGQVLAIGELYSVMLGHRLAQRQAATAAAAPA